MFVSKIVLFDQRRNTNLKGICNTGDHSAKNRRNFPSHKHKCKTVRTLSYDLEKPQGFETVTLRIRVAINTEKDRKGLKRHRKEPKRPKKTEKIPKKIHAHTKYQKLDTGLNTERRL